MAVQSLGMLAIPQGIRDHGVGSLGMSVDKGPKSS